MHSQRKSEQISVCVGGVSCEYLLNSVTSCWHCLTAVCSWYRHRKTSCVYHRTQHRSADQTPSASPTALPRYPFTAPSPGEVPPCLSACPAVSQRCCWGSHIPLQFYGTTWSMQCCACCQTCCMHKCGAAEGLGFTWQMLFSFLALNCHTVWSNSTAKTKRNWLSQ